MTNLLKMFFKYIVSLPRWVKILIHFCTDIVLCILTVWASFSLRYDGIVSFSYPVLAASILSTVLAPPIFFLRGHYISIARYAGHYDFHSIFISTLVYSFFFIIAVNALPFFGIPRSIALIQPTLLATALLIKLQIISSIIMRNNELRNRKRHVVLIYGAGSAGRQLLSALRQDQSIRVLAFIDESSQLVGVSVNGIRVYSPSDLSWLIDNNFGISEILLAIPSISVSRRTEIIQSLSQYNLRVRTIPSFSSLSGKKLCTDDIVDIRVEDVLGRAPVDPCEALLKEAVTDKVVLVTGAGGSIGSELCRQIFAHNPKVLIMLDNCEYALYKIENELGIIPKQIKLVSTLVSVNEYNDLTILCKKYSVDIFFHAAAYKHVPIVEANPKSAVVNNVFGTVSAIESACTSGVKNFVLISTDKAVRPSSIMGCTKRIAELALTAQHAKLRLSGNGQTKLTTVRFGNVLGSSGSVMEVFSKQIELGGPITVTHPEVTRYFMTKIEAAQLVIQASLISEGGDVMLLDMGEPIKIRKLAEAMIYLSGRTLKSDNDSIKISYTGLRNGEKLHEELLIDEGAMVTQHPKIRRAYEATISPLEFDNMLQGLKIAIDTLDNESLSDYIRKLIPEIV